MLTGAVRKSLPRLDMLQSGGQVVVDASSRFEERRHAPALAPEDPPAPCTVASLTEAAAAKRSRTAKAPPKRNHAAAVRTAPARDDAPINANPCLVFILAYRWPEIQEEIRIGNVSLDREQSYLFTVVRAPAFADEIRKRLAPYQLRGWSLFPFRSADEPARPAALRQQDDPYALFRAAVELLPPEEQRNIRRLNFRFVSDPLHG